MVFYFLIFASSSILSLFFLCSSVSEALFTLSFSFLSERFFFVVIKLLLRVVEINNTGVTGQSLLPKNDFEHARGLRNSAYAVNLTYETYRHIYIYISREFSIEHPSVGLASLAQLSLDDYSQSVDITLWVSGRGHQTRQVLISVLCITDHSSPSMGGGWHWNLKSGLDTCQEGLERCCNRTGVYKFKKNTYL